MDGPTALGTAVGATIGIVAAATSRTNVVRKAVAVGGGALAGAGVGEAIEGSVVAGVLMMIVGGGALIWGESSQGSLKRAYLGRNPRRTRRRYRRLKR